MIAFYVNKILSGTLIIEKVPALWKKKVQEELKKIEKAAE